MRHAALDQVLERAQRAKSDSDFTYFFSLLLAGEALTKVTTLGILAALTDDPDRNRYRLEHQLVRSSGLGDWSRTIEDALTGQASQYLLAEAHPEQIELTKLSKAGDWQYAAVVALKAAIDHLGVDAEPVPLKSDMKRWFRLFVTLRNKTRAHGAMHPAKAGQAAAHLLESIDLFVGNFGLFKRSWAFLYRNLSGKYRVSPVAGEAAPFSFLNKKTDHSFQNGLYLFLGMPRRVPLIETDPELQDFFFANGGFDEKRFELLSYLTDNKTDGASTAYSAPPGTLPPSDTEGHGELLLHGNCFSNVPDSVSDYVSRPKLEDELQRLLLDDKRPIVTLRGRGGIGKTSLALKVLQHLYENVRYQAIVWFSSRDVDLQLSGPKPVRPRVLSPEDMGRFYSELVLSPAELKDKTFRPLKFLEQQLYKCDLGSCLFVFDNFETTQNPLEMYTWIDSFVRLPNKALITTRLRDFKGDYWLEVPGMEENEARVLVDQTAAHLGITELLDAKYVDDVILQSDGHPYVIKILLGEVARAREKGNVRRIVAGSDEILVALFERTYASLSPCAQRAFLTLSAWNSAVPRIALEAVLLRSTEERSEVEKGIESLLQFSIAEINVAPTDGQEFVRLPMVASIFGKKKLNISPFRDAVHADVEMLQMLGPSRGDDIHLGLAKRLESFIENVARRVDHGASFESFEPVVEMICRAYNPGWILLARWHLETATAVGFEKAKKELRRFLENEPTGSEASVAWRMLARACYQTGDRRGEIHASIERAQDGSIPFYEISSTANRLNQLWGEYGLEIERDEKQQLAQRILAVMDKRRVEAEGDDFSRMAWLAKHLGNETKALEYAEAGLRLDPQNHHCRRILDRRFV